MRQYRINKLHTVSNLYETAMTHYGQDYQLLLLQKQFIGHNEAAVCFILNSPDSFNFVVMQGNDKMQKIRRDEYFRDIIGAVAMYSELTLTGTTSGIVQSWNSHHAFGVLREEKSQHTFLFHVTGKRTKNWIPEKGDRVQFRITMDNMKHEEIAVDIDYIGDMKPDLRDDIGRKTMDNRVNYWRG